MQESQTENTHWKRLNEILATIESGISTASANIDFDARITLPINRLRRIFRQLAFERLELFFAKFNDQEFINAKVIYYREYCGLDLDAQKLQTFYLTRLAHVIRRQEV